MNIVVCLKQVPDTEAQIKIGSDGKTIDTQDIKWIINPYDEFGVEEALRIKEKLGGTVTILCMGPQRAVESIRTALAMGADKAVHLCDPALENGDAMSAAKALAAALKGMEYDLIWCGKQATDDDSAQFGSILSEYLGLPEVNVVVKCEVSEDQKSVTTNRQIEGGEEVVECQLPAVLTAQKGLNEPRYASLPGIMKAKKKELKTLTLSDIGLSADEVGKAGSNTEISKMSLPSGRTAAQIIEGEGAEETAPKLAMTLRMEAKII
ncbi:MAG: electron transfer flavoprotein subunit beta/FixA family protein [Thermodesulfobacteriota bacterium]|nr:electron transfer flavoprotein subunit beta/FixA family protein [Thermodesulfobacteriota bacterium]